MRESIRKYSDEYLWNGIFRPQNKLLFTFRIWMRVQWLLLKQWWQHFQPWIWLKTNLSRPVGVMLAVLLPLMLLYWLGIPIGEVKTRLIHLFEGKNAASPLSWQTALILIGAPIAFILWAFRDYNARQTIENQRKDINLKEFQEIQMRAAGALDEKLPAKARETLQIAAIHQLRPFLRGEYGASFRRPAWELLRARLKISAEQHGYAAIKQWSEERARSQDDKAPTHATAIKGALNEIKPDPVTLAEHAIINEERASIFRHDLPLRGSALNGIDLSEALLIKADLQSVSFIGANLHKAHLEGAYLWRAHLEGAYLDSAHLEGADLIVAHLEGANLNSAHLEGANLMVAHLEGANLVGVHLEGAKLPGAHLESAGLKEAHLEGANLMVAHLEGANLYEAHLEGANLYEAHLEGAHLAGARIDETTMLRGAIYDDDTQFAYHWNDLDDQQKEQARQPWIDRGIVHIDDA